MKVELNEYQISELKQALKDKKNAQHHRKIQALILYSECQNLTAVAKSVGFVHQTVRNLLNRYLEGGLEALLTENRGGRRHFYLTHEEEEEFLEEQASSAMNGEFVTVDTLFEAYQKRVGRKTSREGFYALLKRHGWRKVSPRPQHPKKADAKTILASKNKITI
ncbi:winged helix-turn-helix domain-containing protein [Streptococcus sp. 19428wA2_WM07]|nr:winged helix-turn-helix domain-containing protein [Streptococcus sp. 19428wA2_WM07]TFU27350.1 hypothetical protein E4T71_07245 [Streptococcus sp. WM07]